MSGEHGPMERQPSERSQPYSSYPELSYRDELSLADLFHALGRRWFWIAGTVLVALVLATAYVSLTPEKYDYSLDLKIGQQPYDQSDTRFRPIEASETVVAQLRKSYIPAAIRGAREDSGAAINEDYVPEVEVDSPDDSLIVSLTADAAKSRGDFVGAVLRQAAGNVLAEHSELLAAVLDRQRRALSRLRSRLQAIQARLETLADRRDALGALAKRSQAAALAAGTELSAMLNERGQLVEKQAEI